MSGKGLIHGKYNGRIVTEVKGLGGCDESKMVIKPLFVEDGHDWSKFSTKSQSFSAFDKCKAVNCGTSYLDRCSEAVVYVVYALLPLAWVNENVCY